MAFSHNRIYPKFTNELPGDSLTDNVPRQVEGAAYSFVAPTKTAKPSLIVLNDGLAQSLALALDDEQQLADLLTGNVLPEAFAPYAMNYGGHQFGHWAGQLGDGRAINLVQVLDQENALKTLQLKGAGTTPYSRGADGLAVLRSSIREFLCSEAMFHLGVSTTRALSLCLTGDQVMRDMFYDGHPQLEQGAIVCRVSGSFMRFGTFQLPTARGDIALLKQLADYSICTDFPHLGEPSSDVYLDWFKEVCQRTCDLMVNWMRVGFVHGVMNTDNMSIIGETIDYGPYGWIDQFDLDWTPNTTDAQGKRYRFGAQPQIAQWNLFQLANAIYPLINEADGLNQALTAFATQYEQAWAGMMAQKLGLTISSIDEDTALFNALEQLLHKSPIDMTIFFRELSSLPDDRAQWLTHLSIAFYDDFCKKDESDLNDWLTAYHQRQQREQLTAEQRQSAMNKVNPKYVLRNYIAQQVIEKAEQGDMALLHDVYRMLQAPYDEQPEFEHFYAKRPSWAINKPGCSMLSCSS